MGTQLEAAVGGGDHVGEERTEDKSGIHERPLSPVKPLA